MPIINHDVATVFVHLPELVCKNLLLKNLLILYALYREFLDCLENSLFDILLMKQVARGKSYHRAFSVLDPACYTNLHDKMCQLVLWCHAGYKNNQ